MASADPDCPDPVLLLRYAEQDLGETQRARLDVHLERCSACLLAVATLGRVGESEPPQAPRTIGRYSVTGVLGAGNMGTVYRATDPVLDRAVALKVLRDRTTTEEGRLRLLREARAASRVRHPNVVTIHDAEDRDGEVFVAMELVDGMPLDEYCRREKPRWRVVLGLMLQAAHGLAAIHAAGIVHRDFKPSNVLVTEEGRVVVTDFGLAAEIASPEVEHRSDTRWGHGRLTLTGAVLGTPVYMAPEVMDHGVATPLADQFAFCATLVEALTGRPPFSASSFEALLAQKRRSTRPLVPGPRALTSAIVQGLQPIPSRRFSDMTALIASLENIGRRRSRAWIAGLTTAAAVLVLASTSDPARTCSERNESFWPEARQTEFASAIAPHVDGPAAARVQRRAAQFADGLRETYADLCPRLSGALQDADLDVQRRWLCAETQRAAFESVTANIASDPRYAKLAAQLIDGLPRPGSCEAGELSPETAVTPELLEMRRDTARLRSAVSALDPTAPAALQQQLSRARALSDAAGEAELLYLLGKWDFKRAADEPATARFEAAYELAMRIGDERIARRTTQALVATMTLQRRWAEAELWAKVAGPLHRSEDDRADLLLERAVLAMNRGQFESAHELLLEVQELTPSKEDDLARWVRLQFDLGTNFFQRERPIEAREHLRAAVAGARELEGDTGPRMGPYLNNLASVEIELGGFTAARDHLLEAIEVASATPETTHWLDNAKMTLANAYAGSGQWEQAHAMALELESSLSPPLLASLHLDQGLWWWMQGDLQRALSSCERSRDEATRVFGDDFHTQRAQAYSLLIRAMADQWTPSARAHALALVAEGPRQVDATAKARATWALARVALQQGRHREAARSLRPWATEAEHWPEGSWMLLDLAAAVHPNDPQEARQLVRTALAKTTSSDPVAIQSHLRAAELLLDWGERGCALEHAEAARVAAASDPSTPFLRARAEDLLDDLAASSASCPSDLRAVR